MGEGRNPLSHLVTDLLIWSEHVVSGEKQGGTFVKIHRVI